MSEKFTPPDIDKIFPVDRELTMAEIGLYSRALNPDMQPMNLGSSDEFIRNAMEFDDLYGGPDAFDHIKKDGDT